MPGLLGPLLIVCLLLTLVLVWVSLTLSRDRQRPQTGLGFGTRYFLVLLRLAIGWHFLVEGLDKLNSPAWSSAVYLQEATGPLAPYFRDLAGDRLGELLTVGADKQLPENLQAAWQAYFRGFESYYDLDAEQSKRAETIFPQQESRLLTWLTSESKLIARPQPQGPPLMVDMTVPERLEDLRRKEQAVRDIETTYRSTFGKDTFTKLKDAKAEAKRIRTELKSDLAKQTAGMRNALRDVLTDEQKKLDPPSEAVALPIAQWSRLDWADALVKYGLTAVGGCLLIGLLTRVACLGGAGFLLLFFLAMPPLPGWPESPRAEGHYLYLNKNIIEMLALLALATTRSGRWAGLDGLLQFVNPRRRQQAPPRRIVADFPEANAAGRDPWHGTAVSASVPKETAHGP